MGKDKERKSYQPSSSAKAAEQLASGGPKAAGFAFGGWACFLWPLPSARTLLLHCIVLIF